MDSDLIGVVVAAVCVGVLAIVIISLTVYCCFRRGTDWDKNSSHGRKDSRGSVTTCVTPRWVPTMVPNAGAVPVYSVPTEPVIYSVPPQGYYLGGFTPKFIDAGRLNNVRPHRHALHDDPNRSPSLHLVSAAQPNGHVVHDFSSSSVNYRVIRKQHKHEKMPDWLRKTYSENEQSLELGQETGDAGSRPTSAKSTDVAQPSPHKESVVRADVSPRNSRLESQEVLRVPQDFTIVDFVDPEGRPVSRQPTLSPSHRRGDDLARYRTTTTTTTSVTADDARGRDAPRGDVGVGVGGPRAPLSSSRPLHTFAPVSKDADETSFQRQRRAGEGSPQNLPAATMYLNGRS